MKKIFLLALALISAALFAIPANVEIYFSPNGGCQQAIIDAITEAGSTIDVAMYTFTEGDIANALIAAKNRGLEVRVVLDGENVNGTYSKATYLANNGVPVRYETKSGLLHDKFAVIDDSITLTGSFNWTTNAEGRNYENLLIITSLTLASEYAAEFEALWLAATSIRGTSTSSSATTPSVSPAPVPQPSTNDETVYITKTGSKYHSAGCSYLRSSCIPISKSKAIARGYTPCSRCNP